MSAKPLEAAFHPNGELNLEELKKLVYNRPWFHRIDLGNGIITPGIDDSPSKLDYLHFPKRFDGLSVLDIGAYDGFFSFEAERRGARRVVAADQYSWTATGMGDGNGFRIARMALKSKVEDVVIPVENISDKTVGTFDVVFFLGVLYHSPDPLRYLRNVRSVCRGQLILETHVDALDYSRPAMVFYPGDSLNNDPSNFWGPNNLCVELMLKEVGFRKVELVQTYNVVRSVFHAWV